MASKKKGITLKEARKRIEDYEYYGNFMHKVGQNPGVIVKNLEVVDGEDVHFALEVPEDSHSDSEFYMCDVTLHFDNRSETYYNCTYLKSMIDNMKGK